MWRGVGQAVALLTVAVIWHFIVALLAKVAVPAKSDERWEKRQQSVLQDDKVQRMPPWKFLGLEITALTIVPQILEINCNPKTLADLHSLCGSLNWARPCLGLTNEDLDPVYNLLKGERELVSLRELTPEAKASIEKAKLSHQQYHQNVPGLIRQFQQTRSRARDIVATCPSCQLQAMPSLAYVSKEFLEFVQQCGVEHKTGIPHSPTGQAVIERAHQTLKQVLARQSSSTVWMSPQQKLCKAMFTINFLNCSFENMNPPVVRHFNSEKNYLPLNPVMNPIQVVFLLTLNSLAAAWIISQPHQNIWVTLAQTLQQEKICLSTAAARHPMSTSLVGVQLKADEYPTRFNTQMPNEFQCRPQFVFSWMGVQYTWNHRPQGWKHSPTICHGLIQAALVKGEAPEHLQYIDDIIVWGNMAMELFEKGEKIIQILLGAGFAIRKSKVKGPAQEIRFLGEKWQDGRHQFPTEVINKITAIQIVSPLYLVNCKKNDFHWCAEQQQAFAQIKQEIAHAIALGPVRTGPEGWLERQKKANWKRRGKPIWAADEWKDIATRVEKLPVKVHHVDAHVPKSQANEEQRHNEQVDQASKIEVSKIDWQQKGEWFLARWAHDASGHQGRDATYKWARDQGVDLTMDSISLVIHDCETCTAIKQAKRVKPLWYGGHWSKYKYGEAWQIDYITLPQTRLGKRYVLTIVEATTRWLETYPVPHATALNTIEDLEEQVLWRHGTPERIESDNGTHFKNGLINT
ncbi:hypothetical protein TURU_016966 [Turdus rufiventris]|nr:hypothetical protein TURU_016966 [Turdus rufiventris]